MKDCLRIYVAGPMRGIKDFNFPAFHAAAKELRAQGHEVFSPAEADIRRHGDILKSATGDEAEIASKGFNLREALYEDTKFICLEGEAVFLLPGWKKSKGARAECALAEALGLKIIKPKNLIQRMWSALSKRLCLIFLRPFYSNSAWVCWKAD